jgi:hypothetical protein
MMANTDVLFAGLSTLLAVREQVDEIMSDENLTIASLATWIDFIVESKLEEIGKIKLQEFSFFISNEQLKSLLEKS